MPKTAKKETGTKSKKAPNPYNVFMKEELARLKKADPKVSPPPLPNFANLNHSE